MSTHNTIIEEHALENTMIRQRNIVSVSLMAFLICGMVAGVRSGANAQNSHPHYLHALADLRYARAFLVSAGENNLRNEERRAYASIDRAMKEIKRAAIDDGKNPEDHPAIDTNVRHRDRLHKVMALLGSARRDLTVQEDDKVALGWRKAALKHIADAQRSTNAAYADAKNDR